MSALTLIEDQLAAHIRQHLPNRQAKPVSTFRKTYRQLSEAEQEHVEQIKDSALALELLIVGRNGPKNSEQARHIALAMTNLEQAVMWAVKAYT